MRPILPEDRVHPAIRSRIDTHHADFVAEVEAACARHPVVVVGMGGNPFVRKARRALEAAGVTVHAIDHGNYVRGWRRRNALKMWTGWPTFPMVFVRGRLVGGADDVAALVASGELQRLLAG